ncbi:MAG: excinuclease ABC subunit UvrA [Microscillaceae bacterium]|nr:excinuclease ABC subunit UvrA [Microscillaceae bacterium]
MESTDIDNPTIIKTPNPLDNLSPQDYIIVRGAKVNNLKNLSVAIPRNKLVVITGLSGSGKSSLAFDTLFAEGQRMYVESLSSYARQFLGRMEKPDVESIQGIAPAIAVEQKGNTKNPRATVGTTTEIYDYFKLLFARIGVTYSPISQQAVKKDTVTDVVNYIQSFADGQRVVILAPLQIAEGRSLGEELKILFQKGFSRIVVNDETIFIEDLITIEVSPEFLEDNSQESDNEEVTNKKSSAKAKKKPEPNSVLQTKPKLSTIDIQQSAIYILIDRAVINQAEEDNQFRLADSVQTAFYEGHGTCRVEIMGLEKRDFSDKFELDGITFEEPSVAFFSFNSPYGACKRCGGFGSVLAIDENLVIPDKTLSVYEGAVAAWRTDKMHEWQEAFVKATRQFDFPIHRSYEHLNEAEKEVLWNGNQYAEGISQFFNYVESQSHKIQYRVMMSRYRGKIVCPDCRGTRLRKDAGYVKIGSLPPPHPEGGGAITPLSFGEGLGVRLSISDLVLLPIQDCLNFFQNLQLSDYQQQVAQRILPEITNRLTYLDKVGLGYLTLNRLTATLSGGEYQRIKLATALGSALVGSMYILDEPSIGLHPRDTARLVEVLQDLRDLGNTVIVVEHEEEVMHAADQIIDIGPEAGSNGGNLVFQGDWISIHNYQLLMKNGNSSLDSEAQKSYTIQFLTKLDSIEMPKKRRAWKEFLAVKGAKQHNLKNITVQFPLDVLTVVTGVSGSGKSTLVKSILYPALAKHFQQGIGVEIGQFSGLGGSLKYLQGVEFVDQNPIGKSSRSNPATYTKVYDVIRDIFAGMPLAKQRGYESGHFSFNSEKGRCDTCEGEGRIQIEMQFMADVYLTCESCGGKRFKKEILDIEYQGKTVADVLEMTIDDALEFFQNQNKVVQALAPLANVGLGYVRLGQSTSTLSGGEAQRLKLASFLKEKRGRTLFIFDEPTTGLHFHDIKKLLKAFNALIDNGNSVLVIEHNLEVIKCADWIIDLGPEGGGQGGHLSFAGLPEDLIQLNDNHTAGFLRGKVL